MSQALRATQDYRVSSYYFVLQTTSATDDLDTGLPVEETEIYLGNIAMQEVPEALESQEKPEALEGPVMAPFKLYIKHCPCQILEHAYFAVRGMQHIRDLCLGPCLDILVMI